MHFRFIRHNRPVVFKHLKIIYYFSCVFYKLTKTILAVRKQDPVQITFFKKSSIRYIYLLSNDYIAIQLYNEMGTSCIIEIFAIFMKLHFFWSTLKQYPTLRQTT